MGARTAGDDRRTLAALLAITAVGLLARLIGLGARIFHWDEGRVGYWILRYQETGIWEYRPIVHGPFLYHVDALVFDLIGASDFSARLVVALVGGLLPFAAWLFRERLSQVEVVSLGGFLAINPVLLYYSRFMRNDVLVATFMLFALGFFVRALDTDSTRYLYPGAASLGLAFTTKENAIIYLLCWAGALALLLDHRLLLAPGRRRERTARTGGSNDSPIESLADGGTTTRSSRREIAFEYGRATLDRLRGWIAPLVGASILFLAIIIVFYAPRTAGEGLGFNAALADPTLLPALIERTLTETGTAVYELWIAGGHQDHAYLPYLGDYLETMLYGATVLSVVAVIGFLADRYSAGGPRDLVALSFYWGFVSVLGYPIVTDIQAPWATIHAIVPLAVPAAVGAAVLYRWGRDAVRTRDVVGISLAVVLVVLAAGTTAATATSVAYLHPDDRTNEELLQWAQASDDLKPALEEINRVAARNEGTDVLFWGTHSTNGEDELFYVENESSDLQPAPEGGWYDRLPLPWYLERYNATTESTPPGADPEIELANPPPVVIAYQWNRSDLEPYLKGYTVHEEPFKLWDEEIVIFIDESRTGTSSADPTTADPPHPAHGSSAAIETRTVGCVLP
jgi:uncharacterized protein (TIGR03663 family)